MSTDLIPAITPLLSAHGVLLAAIIVRRVFFQITGA